MLTLPAFEYHAPTSVAQALALLEQHGSRAKLLAGGTDLVPNLKHRLVAPLHVVGLRQVAALRELREEQDALVVGPMVTVAQLEAELRVQMALVLVWY